MVGFEAGGAGETELGGEAGEDEEGDGVRLVDEVEEGGGFGADTGGEVG